MLPKSEKSNIIFEAQSIISRVCAKQIGEMKHDPFIETDFTGSFVKYGIPELDAAFSRLLNRYNVKVRITSVYIHQSPMVVITESAPRSMDSNKCELGDVLLVQSHRRDIAKTYWRASLWQLKKDKGTFQTSQDPQHWLYDQWPSFEVYRGGLAAGERDFNRDKRSGCFALVSPSTWLICPPSRKIGPLSPGAVDAAQFIVEMMYAVDPAQPGRNDNCGRRVFTRPSTHSPSCWSATIWELLNVTGSRDFNARKLFAKSHTRISFLYDSGHGLSSHTVGPPNTEPSEGYEPDRGMLVLVIASDASDYDPYDKAGSG